MLARRCFGVARFSCYRTINNYFMVKLEKPMQVLGKENKGLFGVEGLNSPSDLNYLFNKVKNSAIIYQNEIIELDNQSLTIESAKKIIFYLNEMSDILCSISDPSTACSRVHTNKEWIKASHEINNKFKELFGNLNSNPKLSKACASIIENEKVFNSLDIIEQRVIKAFYHQFIMYGYSKSEEIRNEIIQFQQKLDDNYLKIEECMYIPSKNSAILQYFTNIIQIRNEIAKLSGKGSFSHLEMNSHDKFKDHESAIHFLENFRDNYLAKVKETPGEYVNINQVCK